jgi:ornithine carbamoyltransferase
LACPEPCSLPRKLLDWAREQGADIHTTVKADEAARDADCIVTDTWMSMANGTAPDLDRETRLTLLAPYRVDERIMALAKPDAIFMHCLPASREREVAAAVIDGPQSVVWDEAENRVHAQKGILHWCLV